LREIILSHTHQINHRRSQHHCSTLGAKIAVQILLIISIFGKCTLLFRRFDSTLISNLTILKLFPPWRSPIADDEDQFTDAQPNTPITAPRTQRTIRQAKNKEKRAKANRSIQLDNREPLRRVDYHQSYANVDLDESSESETDTMVSTRHLNAKKKAAAEKRKRAAALKDDEEGAQDVDISTVLNQLPLNQLPREQLQAGSRNP